MPELPEVPLRIEGGAYRGRPVYFRVIGPWTRTAAMEEASTSGIERSTLVFGAALVGAVFLLAFVAARHNLRSGRGDRAGAMTIARVVGLMTFCSFLAGAHYVGDASVLLNRALEAAAVSLVQAALIWGPYLALEPVVRRRWPASLVSWSRLLAGRWRDPMVGRDVLIGLVAGASMMLMMHGAVRVGMMAGAPPPPPVLTEPTAFEGVRQLIGSLLTSVAGIATTALIVILVFAFVRLKVRTSWLAFGIASALFAVMIAGDIVKGDRLVLEIGMVLAISMALTAVAWRFGLVPLAVMLSVSQVFSRVPLVPDVSTWYSSQTLVGFGVLLGLAFYGFVTARAEEPLLGRPLFEER